MGRDGVEGWGEPDFCQYMKWEASTAGRLYKVWQHMLSRCYDKRARGYPRYGGRGIRVCEEWRGSLGAFRAWAEANGYRHGLQLDRQDNDGDYAPHNCRFVTRSENCRNRRMTSAALARCRRAGQISASKSGRAVRCVETGAVYPSVCAAARHVKRLPSQLFNLLAGGYGQTMAGFHWVRHTA